MASVIIEKRANKSGTVSYRARVQQIHQKKVVDRISKTFKTKALAKNWAVKIQKEMEEKYERVRAGVY